MTTAYTPGSNGNGHNQVAPQYPKMPEVPDTKPLLDSLGATGTSIMSGIITQEEYNPDWFWRDGVHIVAQMLRNDGQITAMQEVVELPIRSADWSIKPGSEDPRDVEIASFIDTALFKEMCYTTASGRKLTQKWDDTLRQILLFVMYGFMVFELNYRIEDGWVKWSRWTPLLPKTVYRWWVGPDTELAGIQQWTWKDYNWHFVDIPADKLLHFVRRQEGNNFEGISALRAPYKHWFYKDQFYKIDAIGIERNAVVPPVVELLLGYTSDDAAIAKKIVENVRAHENMGVVTTPGMKFEFPKNQQHYAAATMPSIQHHDVMIARSFLAQFINLGSTETGAYALNQSQMEQFLASLQAYCAYICDVINPEIKRLVDYNFTDVESYPTLECSKIIVQNISDLADIFSKLIAGNNPLISPTPELSAWLLKQVGAPVASQNPVENDNPSSTAAPERPENERSGDHGDAETQNVSAAGAGRGQNVRGGAPSSTGDASASGAGDAGAAASEAGAVREGIVEEARLLRETLDAAYGMDAVERGLMMLGGGGNNQYPRQAHGLWGFGPGHMSGGGAGHHGGEGHPSEHDVTGGAHTGGGSGGTGHGGGGASRGSGSAHEGKAEKAAPKARTSRTKSEKTDEEKTQARMARRGKELDKAKADAAQHRSEEEHHAALGRAARAKGAHDEANQHETQAFQHRIHAQESEDKAARLEKLQREEGTARAAKGKAEGEAKVHELTPEERAARGLKPEADPANMPKFGGTRVVRIEPREGFVGDPNHQIDPARKIDVKQAIDVYGEHQLGAYLSSFGQGRLVEAAESAGVTPGRSNHETIQRIVSKATNGRYNAGFLSKGSADDAHTAKVKSLETRIAKAQERLDSLKAQHAELTKAGASKSARSSSSGRSRSSGSSKPSKAYQEWKAKYEQAFERLGGKTYDRAAIYQVSNLQARHTAFFKRYQAEQAGANKTSELEAEIEAETVRLNDLVAELENA